MADMSQTSHCEWCNGTNVEPLRNARGELCPCSCHEGAEGWTPWADRTMMTGIWPSRAGEATHALHDDE